MTLAFRAVATKSPSNSTSHVFPKPAGVASGDFMLLELVVVGSATPNSVPSGWTLFADSITNAGSNSIYVYTKTAGGSEPADYTFGFAASQNAGGGIVAYSSDIAAPIVVDAHDKLTTSASTNRVWPSVTTTVGNTVLIMFCTLSNSSGTTPPGSATERWDSSVLARIYCMTEAVAASGPTGTRTGTGTSSDAYCITIAIAESGSVSGAAALTLDALTLAAAGAVAVKGAASITLGAIMLSASEGVTVHGTAAIALGAVSLAAVGVEAGATPGSFAATAITGSRIDLTWVHNGVGVDGFSIERSTSEFSGYSEIATPAAGDRSYSDTGLAENTRYYYRIRSYRS